MDLQGKTVLITGATAGLGRAVARSLARPGVTLLLHGRDAGRGAQAVAECGASGARARFHSADLSALADVERLASRIGDEHPRIHLLINNAGIGFGPPGAQRETSADGYELRFAVNYLAPVLLTARLLPAIADAGEARIVNLASAGQQPLDFDDLMLQRRYSGTRAYRQSKLALIMWSFDLAEALRARRVVVNALHPATFMDTAMVRESGIAPRSPVEEGVLAVLHLAVDDGGRVTGQYFDGLQPARALPQAYEPRARARLWRATQELIGNVVAAAADDARR